MKNCQPGRSSVPRLSEGELFAPHLGYATPGRYTIAVKAIDIFGNDTMTLVPLTVG